MLHVDVGLRPVLGDLDVPVRGVLKANAVVLVSLGRHRPSPWFLRPDHALCRRSILASAPPERQQKLARATLRDETRPRQL